MSDAFANLWSSTGVSSKPAAEAPRKLGAIAASTPIQVAPKRPTNDVFSMLAAAGSSSSQASRATTPSATAQARPMQKAASTGFSNGDAFSSLLGGSISTGAANTTTLTIAQRAALAEKEKQQRAQTAKTPEPAAQAASAWAGLDALGSSTSSRPTAASSSNDLFDDFGFGAFTNPPAPSKAPHPPPSADDDDWDLGDFSSAPAKAPPPSSRTKASTSSSHGDLLGFDDFMSAPSPPSRQSSSPQPGRTSTPGDFDFGEREGGLLGNQFDDGDDILGDLGKPIEQLAAQRQTVRNTPSPQPPRSGQRSRAVSPPPHILGQIVEMGFSIQQARVALAATDTGLDVQAALETLLSNGAASSSPNPEQQQARRPQREPGHDRYYGSDEEDGVPRQPQRPPARRPSQPPRRPSREDTPPGGGSVQDQADKLMTQASEIGLSMFNRANAFWKEGKERVQRAYEERQAATAGPPTRQTGDAPRRNGRPKWMEDAQGGEAPSETTTGSGSFRDFDDDEPAPPVRPPPQRQAPRPKEPEQPAASPAERMRTGNLLGEETPSVYVSPFRRKNPSRAQASTPTAAPSKPTRPQRAPSPVALVQRQTISASQPAIDASAQQKAAGTEKFKVGQYGEAEALYGAALAALPERHLLTVPLLNNRALTRLKNGDATGAITDCTAVVELIGPSYHPSREAKVTSTSDGAGVDLADALAKAWRRRAEAFEGREKWKLAQPDWEALIGADFAGGRMRQDALAGVNRCKKMLAGDGGSAPSSAPKPAPKPKPAARPAPARAKAPTPPSEALNRVREANAEAEAEDQAKHDLKDAVDTKLAAWRAGKENNLRALIASLDTVLWPELGLQKVGIHELVSPNQVKIRYTRAIAKLHPDKLNVKNTTLEQRMVANGVFGSLNEAWNAFKP